MLTTFTSVDHAEGVVRSRATYIDGVMATAPAPRLQIMCAVSVVLHVACIEHDRAIDHLIANGFMPELAGIKKGIAW